MRETRATSLPGTTKGYAGAAEVATNFLRLKAHLNRISYPQLSSHLSFLDILVRAEK